MVDLHIQFNSHSLSSYAAQAKMAMSSISKSNDVAAGGHADGAYGINTGHANPSDGAITT